MGFKLNVFSGTLDLSGSGSGGGIPDLGPKLDIILNGFAAYDRISNIEYEDFGQRAQRISKMTLSSLQFPDSNITIDAVYADIGKMNQRITMLEIEGNLLLPNKLQKLFEYTLIDNKYRLDNVKFNLI
jgi:hypothetical protein